MADSSSPRVQPTISMPSADLITYRFDQTDKKLEDLKTQMTNMSNAFATKEELAAVDKRIDNWVWYFRALLIAVFGALFTAIAGLVFKR